MKSLFNEINFNLLFEVLLRSVEIRCSYFFYHFWLYGEPPWLHGKSPGLRGKPPGLQDEPSHLQDNPP